MDTTSFWQAISTRTKDYPELTSQIEVDVAIIGGGITGITAANELVKSGKKVAIIEKDKIGGYTTGSSTGNLYIPVQPFYQKIDAKFNFEEAKNVALARRMAIDYIEKNILDHGIECQFARRPWYAYTCKDPRIALDKEIKLLREMELEVDYIDALPLPFKFKKAIMMPNQARFNPLQYVISMGEKLSKEGVLIFENSQVLDILEKKTCTVETTNGKVLAKKVLMATHTPLGINPTQMYVAPYRSYVVSAHLKDKDYPEGHFWDLDRPPHSTCTHAVKKNTPEILMVAGSHHKTGQGPEMASHFKELQKFLKDHFEISEFSYQWSAQHYQSADAVPYIGLATRAAKHTYLATGYWADGLVYGTIAGIIIGNLISEKEVPLAKVFRANRFKPFASAGFLAKENLNVFFQYLKDYPLIAKPSYKEIKKGEGKIVEIKREKCAISRDDNNQLHVVSAVCPHMKCIVNWNNAEKTWDCPCHGSRFSQQGKVLEGPAESDLEKKVLE